MRLFLLACLLMSGWGMAQSSEPSLADLSKEARERKAKTTKPAKIITNADLRKYQNAPVSVSKSRPSDFEPKENGGQTPADAAKADAEKQKLLDEAEQNLRTAAMDYKNAVNAGLVLQLRMSNLNNAYYAEQQESLRSSYEEQLVRTASEIETNKTDVLRTEQALDAARQEAKQAGFSDEQLDKIIGEMPKPPSTESLLPQTNDSTTAETIQGSEPRQPTPPPTPPQAP